MLTIRTHSWSAIVQGAVLSKLPDEASVVSSVGENHYGVAAAMPWNAECHPASRRFFDHYEGIWRVSVMVWYIYKVWKHPLFEFGDSFRQYDDLKRSRAIEFAFYTALPQFPTAKEMQVEYELKMCPCDTAPEYPGGRELAHILG